MLQTVIFIGRSGSGKGTQADLLRNRIAALDPNRRQILHIETGELFRRFIRSEGFSPELSRESDRNNRRQPDFLACSIWGNLLIEQLEENMHIIFDGTPRSFPEAVVISTAMKFYKREKPVVIYINVSRKCSEDRLLSRGRSDDRTLSKITKRLNWFDEDTLPAVEYFRTNNLYRFIEVDGEQTIDKVHADIIDSYEHSS